MRELLKNGSHFLLRRQNNILLAALIIMLTFGFSQIMGLLKTRLLISYFFGTKAYLLDVYYAAFVLPDTIFQLLVLGSLSAAFIPVFTRLLSKNETEAWHVANSALNFTLLLFSLISIIIFIFSVPISKLIAPGFNPLQLSILSQLLRILLFSQFFFCVSGFFTAMIQSHQRFLIPALAPILYNLGIILGTIILSPIIGIYAPAIGAVIGAFLHMLIQFPVTLKLGFRPRFVLDLRHVGVREIIRLMPPRALSLGVDQVEQFVAVLLASLLSAGSLSLLKVALSLYAVPSSLFGVTIGQAALPVLSRQSNDSDRRTFSTTFIESLLQVVFLALPLSLLFIVLRIPIVRIVFGSHSFPWAATLLTGKTLAILAVSATFIAVMQLIYRGFYALHDTRTPLWVGIIAAIFSTTSSFIAVKIFGWGILGLAAVMSVTSVLETLTLFLLFSRRFQLDRPFGRTFADRVLLPLAKMGITSLITGLSLWLPMRLLDQFVFDTTHTLPLLALTLITSAIGLMVYLLFSYLFRVDELRTFFIIIKHLSQWRKLLSSLRATPSIISPPPIS